MEIQTPAWVADAIFYQIFPDRFAKSDRVSKPSNLELWASPPTVHGFKGGDLIGVAERLPYLQALGINAIYLTPIFQSTANHRYHTHDYFQVDPILGGNEALRVLLDEAHERGIRVVLDGVFNHSSRGFYYFNHLLENGDASPYRDWFITSGEWPINAYDQSRPPGYSAWWDLHALPKFNTDTPAVRDYLLQVAEHWIRFGIDGWRLDVPNEINDDDFWREFRARVKGVNPEAYIVGEIWGDASRWLKGDQFDGVMNYLFTRATLGFFVRERAVPTLVEGLGYAPVPLLTAPEFARETEQILGLYPPEITFAQLNLLGSHDTARFHSIAGEDPAALRLATLFQMSYPGAPCIYYGDEIGMVGGKDPASRGAFPWYDEESWDHALLADIQRLVGLRRQYPALRRGLYQPLLAQEMVYAFARVLGEQVIIVVLNAGDSPASPTLDLALLGLSSGQRLQDALQMESPPVVIADGGLVEFHLPARTGALLVPI